MRKRRQLSFEYLVNLVIDISKIFKLVSPDGNLYSLGKDSSEVFWGSAIFTMGFCSCLLWPL